MDKPKKRGRKQDDSLPPSRSRDQQRLFRARKAQHLADLEARVVRLESENNELRSQLGLPPRPPTPTESNDGETHAAGAPSPPESASSHRGEDGGATPSEVGLAGSTAATSPVSRSPSDLSGRKLWGQPGSDPQQYQQLHPSQGGQMHLPSPMSLHQEPQGSHQRWEPQYGRPGPTHSQSDHNMLPSGPFYPSAGQSPFSQGSAFAPPFPHQPLPPANYSQPSFPGPSHHHLAPRRLPSMGQHLPSPTDNPPHSFRPSQQPSFSRQDSAATGTNPCRPDSQLCPPSACAPSAAAPEGGCPPRPSSTAVSSPFSRLPPIQTLLDSSNLGDLDLSPLAALGTYIRPTPRRPPMPTDPAILDDFLHHYCRRGPSAKGAPLPSFDYPTDPYRSFLLTLMSGLELTHKGACGRESFSTGEEMQLNTPAGEACCGGIVDCSGDLFEEEVRMEAEGRPRMKDGWLSCADAWLALQQFCAEPEDEKPLVKQEDGDQDHTIKRRGSTAHGHAYSPSYLAHLLFEHDSPTSRLLATGETSSIVSRNVRCESVYGLMIKDSAVGNVRQNLELAQRGGEGDSSTHQQHSTYQLPGPPQQRYSPYPPLAVQQQSNGGGCCPPR